MIEFKIILLILLIHWLADFCLQTDQQGRTKSVDVVALSHHVATYSLVWLLASYCMLDSWWKAFVFALVTFATHFFVDYNTSRLGKGYWEKQDYHNGFCIVGFDQILHYVQLFICYIWLHDNT